MYVIPSRKAVGQTGYGKAKLRRDPWLCHLRALFWSEVGHSGYHFGSDVGFQPSTSGFRRARAMA